MEERVRYLEGDIKIKGIEGKGTNVTVRIPLEADNPDQS
jgi:signal transduction histidine kinase